MAVNNADWMAEHMAWAESVRIAGTRNQTANTQEQTLTLKQLQDKVEQLEEQISILSAALAFVIERPTPTGNYSATDCIAN
jgi:hypothetical protein